MSLIQFSALKKYILFLSVVVLTIVFTYYAPASISSVWYILLLVLYYRSRDEAFWLVFFFVTTDGFMGFLGIYTTLIKAIPGLPGIEIVQFYIVLSFIKAYYSKNKVSPFYAKWLNVMMIYVILLIVLGKATGLSSELNILLKIVKSVVPLLLFYTIPRLFKTIEDYKNLFSYLFVVLIFGFIAQLNTLFTGFDPKNYFVHQDFDTEMEAEIEVGRNFRVLYNSAIILIGFFGALYFLTMKKAKLFKVSYLNIIIIITFAMAFLSATRGWILSTSLTIILFFVFLQKLNVKQVLAFSAFFIGFLVIGMSNKKISTQIEFSVNRLFTLNSLAKGDMSADGTLIRLSERGPLVMKIWSESPVLGTGFSDKFFKYTDSHVGNQNVLLHAGIVGFALMMAFIFYFIQKMLKFWSAGSSKNIFSKALPVFAVFMPGWLFLHSTSGQQFAFYGLPGDIFPQAIFLSLAGFTYTEYRRIEFERLNPA